MTKRLLAAAVVALLAVAVRVMEWWDRDDYDYEPDEEECEEEYEPTPVEPDDDE